MLLSKVRLTKKQNTVL